MSAPLHDEAPPNSEVFVIAWLLPLAGAGGVGSKLWTAGMPKPYRAVRRVTGADDLISDYPVMRVHTFAATYSLAATEADKTHRRMLLLAEDPLSDVSIGSATANCEWLKTDEGPREEPYGAESAVIRFVAEYCLGLHFAPVS